MNTKKTARPKLSIILPSIRTPNLLNFYQRLTESIAYSFELIIIGPYEPPSELMENSEVKYIQDYGCPSRCQQIGLVNSTGEYVTWGADDGFFLKDKLTEAVDFLEENKTSYKDILTCKYVEAEGNATSPAMYEDIYYKINYHDGLRSRYISNDHWLLNVGIVNTDYAKEIGGWDSQFEVTTISHMDFAVRTQRNGSKYFILEKPIFVCSHLPGAEGDHGPVHYSHVQHDEPLFKEIYNNPDSLNRVEIEVDNWEQSPQVWTRRF